MRLKNLGRIAITTLVAAALGSTAVHADAVVDHPAPSASRTAAIAPAFAGTWTVADIGTPPPAAYSLREIRPTLSGDVIASDSENVFVCWNGTSWAPVPGPGIPQTTGARIGAFGGTSCSDFFVFDTQTVPLRWHWNGQAWSSTPTGTAYAVREFKVFAANDMVAVDTAAKQAQRFDGTAWRALPLPADVYNIHTLGGTSSRDLWLFGKTTPAYDFAAFRWNGTAWTRTVVPAAFAASGGARNVVTVSANEVYVVDFHTKRGYIRWNGTSWQAAAIPTATDAYVNGAAYTAGTFSVSASGYTMHLANGTWTRADLPATIYGRGLPSLLGLATDPRTGTLFGGGSAGGEGDPQGFVLRMQP